MIRITIFTVIRKIHLKRSIRASFLLRTILLGKGLGNQAFFVAKPVSFSQPAELPQTEHPNYPKRLSRLNAALIKPRCVNACGKFPSVSPAGLNCSPKSPR